MVRKLAYGEVRLLLAGTRPAEGNVPDLHHRRPPTGKIGPASHLTPFRFRCGQEALLSSYSLLRSTSKQSSRLLIRAPQPEVAPCATLGSSRRRPLSGHLPFLAGFAKSIELSHPGAGPASSESTNLSDLKYDLGRPPGGATSPRVLPAAPRHRKRGPSRVTVLCGCFRGSRNVHRTCRCAGPRTSRAGRRRRPGSRRWTPSYSAPRQ